MLDTLPLQVAVLDADGTILDVSESWATDGPNGGIAAADVVGENYLDAADVVGGDETGEQAAAGLRELLDGTRSRFEVELPLTRTAGGEE